MLVAALGVKYWRRQSPEGFLSEAFFFSKVTPRANTPGPVPGS